MPDAGTRSGAEIRDALSDGESIGWKFTSNQRRLSLTLPKAFGGATHEVCLVGGYSFEPLHAEALQCASGHAPE